MTGEMPLLNAMMYDATEADQKQPMPDRREPTTTMTMTVTQLCDMLQLTNEHDRREFPDGVDPEDMYRYHRDDTKLTMSVNDFFDMLRQSSCDRPSAFLMYADIVGIANPRELAMHADCLSDIFPENQAMLENEREYLDRIFGGCIPPVLLSNEWDT
jgi:hypothetical protein